MAKRFMPPDEVEKIALDFLQLHHPANTIPIPIEEIIELKLLIDIVPTPGMVAETGVDAATSHDFTQINIDEQQFNSVPNRARFTLAHEVGHLVLHRDFVESHVFKNVSECSSLVMMFLHRIWHALLLRSSRFLKKP
jgi:hypothetical protein